MTTDRCKYRGKSKRTGEWVYGNLVIENPPLQCFASDEKEANKYYIGRSGFADWNMPRPYETTEVDPETVGQYTGLPDKTGKEIYQGDIVQIKTPVRTTQTHTGNNIPNGSYTEPMEPGIQTTENEVIWKDGMFTLDTGDSMGQEHMPMSWNIREWDEESIKQAIEVHKANWSIWDDPEEGDLQYLLEEYKYSNLQEMIDDISGIKVTGNVHDKQQQYGRKHR